jgi:hypothetical protein
MGTAGRPTLIPTDVLDTVIMSIHESYEKGDPLRIAFDVFSGMPAGVK